MKKLKEIKEKLNPKVAIIGGVLVITTSLGTCQLMEEAAVEEAAIEEPTAEPEEPAEEPADKAPESE